MEMIASEINEMLRFYDEMTEYMKPPMEYELPVVDKRVEKVRSHLLVQASTYLGGKNTPELPQELWEVISGCFSSVLWASIGCSKGAGGKYQNEAKARYE
ncbi:uncharacterized protein BT62DRAFT_1013737 [Guyanagaster necrorhizus]|uniref:Uncharacterized protein n=1 Tax=Guyanagaster necrorhizus TaxID=856835 RepID=A0A9P7VER7_9AGAR|nr:uncharacterized protein BT62DRAFT_1013737 [Guyanagaster necrorhizus MCA 3950]KAG7439588.1 hypothetical protein BT62DRAFT_1013737 [Guyanagaster necrorhizus MCA 3950]